MLKFLFEYITNSYSLLKNPINNYIIMTVVGLIAYMIAYRIVGWFYHANLIGGSMPGKVLHWVIRFIVFVVIYYTIATAIRIYNWIINVPGTVWLWGLVISVVLLIVIALIKVIHWKKERVLAEK